MSKRENKRIRQLERRLAVLEKQQTTGCACRSKQEVTVEPEGAGQAEVHPREDHRHFDRQKVKAPVGRKKSGGGSQ